MRWITTNVQTKQSVARGVYHWRFFLETSKPNMNVATRVFAVAQTVAESYNQRLYTFSNESINATCICLPQKFSRFTNINC